MFSCQNRVTWGAAGVSQRLAIWLIESSAYDQPVNTAANAARVQPDIGVVSGPLAKRSSGSETYPIPTTS